MSEILRFLAPLAFGKASAGTLEGERQDGDALAEKKKKINGSKDRKR